MPGVLHLHCASSEVGNSARIAHKQQWRFALGSWCLPVLHKRRKTRLAPQLATNRGNTRSNPASFHLPPPPPPPPRARGGGWRRAPPPCFVK